MLQGWSRHSAEAQAGIRASREEVQWIAGVLNREGRQLGTSAIPGEDLRLVLQWNTA